MKRPVLGAVVLAFALALPVSALAYTSPTWNLNGTYTIPVTETAGPDAAGPYPYAVTITTTSDATGAVAGSGYYITGLGYPTVTVTGQVSGWSVTLNLSYDDPALASYNPFVLTGTIDMNGGMSGTAADGQARTFTWLTTTGSVGLYSPRCAYGTYAGYSMVWSGFAPALTGDTVTTTALDPSWAYFVEASGTYFAGGNGQFDIQADAEYSQDAIQRAASAPWTDSVNNYGSYGEVLLDLMVNGQNVDWGAYNSAHRYTLNVTPTGVPLTIGANIDDIYYPNNTGGLCVAVFGHDVTPPVVSGLTATPNPSVLGGSVTFTATADDSTTGGSNIASAVISFDGGVTSAAMAATDGAFDAVSEGLTYTATAASIGTHDFWIKATDAAGNTSDWAKSTYRVNYAFAGFFAPVDNLPTLNVVKAGSAIPVKFSLAGNQGLNIFATGYPKSVTIACDSSAPADAIDSTVNAGGSSLSYDPLTNQYNYVWKTDKAWAGTCRQLVVKLTDGTSYYANFKFK